MAAAPTLSMDIRGLGTFQKKNPPSWVQGPRAPHPDQSPRAGDRFQPWGHTGQEDGSAAHWTDSRKNQGPAPVPSDPLLGRNLHVLCPHGVCTHLHM